MPSACCGGHCHRRTDVSDRISISRSAKTTAAAGAEMNPTLRNKLIGAIAGGSGAIAIASAMLGNARPRLERASLLRLRGCRRRLDCCDKPLAPIFAVVTDTLIKGAAQPAEGGSAKIGKPSRPAIKVSIPDPYRAALYSFTYNVGSGAFASSRILKN